MPGKRSVCFFQMAEIRDANSVYEIKQFLADRFLMHRPGTPKKIIQCWTNYRNAYDPPVNPHHHRRYAGAGQTFNVPEKDRLHPYHNCRQCRQRVGRIESI